MASPADLDLWHDYLRELKKVFEATGTSEDLRVYAAPLTSVGISIGRSIDQQIVNYDLFRIGDLLLPDKSPVFMPGPSYSQRLLRYLQAAQVTPGRQDATTLKALNDANTALATQTDSFLACRRQAWALYQQDPEVSKISFEDWVAKFYPLYAQAQSSLNAASQLAYQASQVYYGPQTDQLWSDKEKVEKAFRDASCPTYNMPTSVAQLTQGQVVGQKTIAPVNPADIKYEPRYNINSNFSNIVLNWVVNADNKNNKPFKLEFKSSGTPKMPNTPISNSPISGFMDVGFSGKIKLDNDDIVPILPLFTANYDTDSDDESSFSANFMPWDSKPQSTPNGSSNVAPQPTSAGSIPFINSVHNVQAGVGENDNSSVSILIEASDASVFSISPDTSWDIPDVASRYKLSPTASSDLFDPLVIVSYVLLGYQVKITIQTDQTLYNKIDQGLTKAEQRNGTATLFGLNIGAESKKSMIGFDQIGRDSKSRTITIPPRDNSQLTLLGLMGKKLKTSPRSINQ